MRGDSCAITVQRKHAIAAFFKRYNIAQRRRMTRGKEGVATKQKRLRGNFYRISWL